MHPLLMQTEFYSTFMVPLKFNSKMRSVFYLILFILIGSTAHTPPSKISEEKILWMSWEEAMAADQQAHKKKLVDLYTDWCGWCKRMDSSTFQDPEVVAYINANFYPIKFNAEQKNQVVHDNYTFKFVDNGRRGFHELAYSLLNGRMSYPSFVYLDEDSKRILISPGFKDRDQMLTELKFLGGDHYKNESWEDFSKKPH